MICKQIIEKNKFELAHISGECNPADIYTKLNAVGVVDRLDTSKTSINTDSNFVEKAKTKKPEK